MLTFWGQNVVVPLGKDLPLNGSVRQNTSVLSGLHNLHYQLALRNILLRHCIGSVLPVVSLSLVITPE